VRRKIVVGLDIGTTKVCAVAAQSAYKDSCAEVIGMGTAPSTGIKKGVVVDMEATVDSIGEAVSDCEKSANLMLESVYIGITGDHIQCIESYGATGIRGREATAKDIDRVMDAASTVYVPLDREVLHVMPTNFIIDGQEDIVRPEGMAGVRLEANVRVITASHAAVENLVKCCERTGLKVVSTIFEPIASAKAAIKGNERNSGVMLIDIGGGTTDMALFKDGTLRYAAALPVGGNHITNDLAIGLKISTEEAERIKKEFGYASGEMDYSEEIEVRGMDGKNKSMPLGYVGEIVRPRCEEMFSLIRERVNDAVLYSSPACIVLTGGSSQLSGMDRVAEAALGLPVRIGTPQNDKVSAGTENVFNPWCSTSVGLVLHAIESERNVYDDVFEGVVGKLRIWGRSLLHVKRWGFGLR
jgi:cell division protein FtsA